MAKVIEFYIPKFVRKTRKGAPQLQVEDVIEFGARTKQSAFLWLELSLASEKRIFETLHGVDLDHARP